MKKIFLILVCLFIQAIVFSQTEKINCIISVDGKVPSSSWISHLYIIIDNKDSTKVKFDYVLGDFIVDSADYQLLLNNKEKDAIIYFTLYVPHKDNKEYKGAIKVQMLLNSYCLIEVTNFRKERYSFRYTSGHIGSFLGKKDKTILLDP